MTSNHWLSGALLAFSLSASSFTDNNIFNLNFGPEVVATKKLRVNLSSDLIYNQMNLQKYGISMDAVSYAIQGYNHLMNEEKVKNSRYLTIIDFSKSWNEKRFFLLDLETQEVVLNTYVMHGQNSGRERAERFSNTIDSKQSSLGFYLTRETYKGKRGYSLRLKGLEDDFNSNALERAVVLHGTNYLNDNRVRRGKLGRSEGCPAIPMPLAGDVIDLVKGGSVIFIYHPTQEYIENSPVLNGEI